MIPGLEALFITEPPEPENSCSRCMPVDERNIESEKNVIISENLTAISPVSLRNFDSARLRFAECRCEALVVAFTYRDLMVLDGDLVPLELVDFIY